VAQLKITWLGRWPIKELREKEAELRRQCEGMQGVGYVTAEWLGDGKIRLHDAHFVREG